MKRTRKLLLDLCSRIPKRLSFQKSLPCNLKLPMKELNKLLFLSFGPLQLFKVLFCFLSNQWQNHKWFKCLQGWVLRLTKNWILLIFSHGLISLKCGLIWLKWGNEGLAPTKHLPESRPGWLYCCRSLFINVIVFLSVPLQNSGLGEVLVTNKGTNIVLSCTSLNKTCRGRW